MNLLILWAVLAIPCTGFCGGLAKEKGYGGWAWLFSGFLFNVLALITIAH